MSTTIARLGRRLRLGMVGGGPGSFIGTVHRTAARLDDHYEVVAAVLSRNPERARAAARAIGIAEARAYPDHGELLAREAEREDGIEVLAIMTPNHMHHAAARDALARGLDVICDKPLTTRLEDALDLVRRVAASGLVFCTTYNYTGYPMVRHARAMVRSGALGAIRKGKTDQKLSVGSEVQAVAYAGTETEIQALRAIERDLRAAVRAGALSLAVGEPSVSVTLKPAEL